MAVQRRRPGVPRRSFGISLTPPLIISLFLPVSFVAESGNAPYKPARAAASPRAFPDPLFEQLAAQDTRVQAGECTQICANARTHEHARARVSEYGRPSLAAGKKERRKKGANRREKWRANLRAVSRQKCRNRLAMSGRSGYTCLLVIDAPATMT